MRKFSHTKIAINVIYIAAHLALQIFFISTLIEVIKY